jgi:hypothetical protein
MGLNFSSLGAMFQNPIVILFLVIGGGIVLLLLSFFVVKWARRGFGAPTKPKEKLQRCLCITGNNRLTFYNLATEEDFVYDEESKTCHELMAEALLPDLDTGELYLPIDDRSAMPHFPLDPEKRKAATRFTVNNIKRIAIEHTDRSMREAQAAAAKTQDTALRHFALVTGFAIVLLIIIATIWTRH